MSYVLINGKRHFKDDRTGQIVLDDVSQEVADRRGQQYPWTDTSPPSPPRTPMPAPAQPPRVSAPASAQPRRRPGPLQQLISLLHRTVHTATIAVAAGSLLLIGAYCMKEPIQFQAAYHYELRDTEGIFIRLEEVAERLTEVLATERSYKND